MAEDRRGARSDGLPAENGRPGTQYLIPDRPWLRSRCGPPAMGTIMSDLCCGMVAAKTTKD
jgi:hypothetical protein